MISFNAFAHKGSDTYWRLEQRGTQLSGSVDVAQSDLAVLPNTRALLNEKLRVEGCTLNFDDGGPVKHSDGEYLSFVMRGTCDAEKPEREVTYGLLFDLDVTHRGLLSVAEHWVPFTSNSRTQLVSFVPVPKSTQAWAAFTAGVHHISIGWDHLCFLFALLLPSVLRREKNAWAPRDAFKQAFIDITKVVTAFTLAHSVTLALSAFRVVTPNAQFIEIAIAASVALAAANNLFPVVRDARWTLAFALGLLHGFGFVSAIDDLGASDATRALSVLCFNLGVEAGQLTIVALAVPILWKLRVSNRYRTLLFPLGSAVILGLALYWTVTRIQAG